MNWLLDPDRVRAYQRIIAINIAAAAVNLAIGFWTWGWLTAINWAAAAFSARMALQMYRRLPEIRREQEQRLLTLLRG